jgi:CRP/FNR family cyclic AMP-dependent transcriptional regulator
MSESQTDANASKSADEQSELSPELSEQHELVTQLGECSLFTGLGEAVLRRLARTGVKEDIRRNEFVFREGDEGDKVFIVLEGAIRISRTVPGMGEEALAVLRPGSAFGEMALIDGSPRSADALAHETSSLFVIDKEEMEKLMFVDRALAGEVLWRLVRILAKRLRQTNDKMTFLSITGRFE